MTRADFFREMYEKYTAKIPDRKAFLKRIGIENEEISVTREGLDKLQFAFLCSVPFENLDIYDYGVQFDFGIEELYEKIVVQRRGGYCFELNALFTALLEELGFDVYSVGVRIALNKFDNHYPPISHRAAIVTFDGIRYFTDVGFGMSLSPATSLCIDDHSMQTIRGETFSVEDLPHNNKLIILHGKEGPTELFAFSPDPFNILDFMTYNTTIQATGFREKRIVNLRKPDGTISVDGTILRETTNGLKVETPLVMPLSVNTVLKDRFGMILKTPLKENEG